MGRRWILATSLGLVLFTSGAGFARADGPEVGPARLSGVDGDVRFHRPGVEDWGAARLNTPLSPGDALETGAGGNAEIQLGPRAFVRAAGGTRLDLGSQEADGVRLRVGAGHVALDLRDAMPGRGVEIETPNGSLAVGRAGYYRIVVAGDASTFAALRGGRATLTPAGGAPVAVAADRQVVVTGQDGWSVRVGAAAPPSAWDRWNERRTDALLGAASVGHVGPEVYGADALDRYGSWRTVDTYGAVWTPANVPAGWSPYTTGRWIWDPRFGWTWLDEAPWGWAPYHYGRWVLVGRVWAWAPGPLVVRPVYSPALVVFLGGGVGASVGAGWPLYWAPLGWGEPLIPWWGRPGFVGVATWRGWGGPRVTSVTVYRHVHVTDAVVGVSAERFGRDHERPRRIDRVEARRLTPVRGALDVRPAREPERRAVLPRAPERAVQPAPRAAAPAPAAPPPSREQREPRRERNERRHEVVRTERRATTPPPVRMAPPAAAAGPVRVGPAARAPRQPADPPRERHRPAQERGERHERRGDRGAISTRSAP
jgi:hypothetical protein